MSTLHLERKVLHYSVAGIFATIPMTLWMLAADRLLSPKKEELLPPEQITKTLADSTGIEPVKLHKPTRETTSTVNHYVVGATAAIPFLMLGKPGLTKGIFYGFLVWSINYVGILPQLKLYPSAIHKSARLNTIMIVAHLIWGGFLGKFLFRNK